MALVLPWFALMPADSGRKAWMAWMGWSGVSQELQLTTSLGPVEQRGKPHAASARAGARTRARADALESVCAQLRGSRQP